MRKATSTAVCTLFALNVLIVPAFAQDQKKEQVHKGTQAQGTVQKKGQKKGQKKDQKKDSTGTGAQKKGQ